MTSLGLSLKKSVLDPQGSFWFPPQASNNAELVDDVYYFIYWVSVVSFVLIILFMLHFVRKYRKKKHDEMPKEQSGHNTLLEVGWSLPVAIVAVILFYFGAIGYLDARTPPPDAYEVRVNAYKWNWEFQYAGGCTQPDLHVPANTPIRLVLSSDDVLHSFFVPAFRAKQDVVPGRYTDIYFEANQTGEFQVFCTEYCGTKHSEMLAKAIVHPRAKFDQELEKLCDILGRYEDPADAGEQLVENKGCPQCHSTDGSSGVGPTFKGLYGKSRPLSSGGSKKADENYIRSSILDPKGDVVQGFNPVMPTFQGKLKDEEIDAIIAYLKRLKD